MWRYEYDGFGRRVERGKTGYVLHFLWDGSSLFAVYAGATALKATYAYFPGGALPHSLRADAETYYLATDDLGSVLGLFGASGVANDYRYDPWGNAQHGSTTVSNWLRWAGSMLDWHEGLYAMGARSYDPELGRFLSEDPLGLSAGINPYAYVGNSPTNGTDPSGLDCYFTWTPYPWCDEATELKVLVQGGGGGAGAVGGYGGSSATGLGGDSDGAGPNSAFAAFGTPGGGASAAARADTGRTEHWWPSKPPGACRIYDSTGRADLGWICKHIEDTPRLNSIRGCLLQFYSNGKYVPVLTDVASANPVLRGAAQSVSWFDARYGIGEHVYCWVEG